MLSKGHVKSSIIVLTCGAGKMLVGVTTAFPQFRICSLLPTTSNSSIPPSPSSPPSTAAAATQTTQQLFTKPTLPLQRSLRPAVAHSTPLSWMSAPGIELRDRSSHGTSSSISSRRRPPSYRASAAAAADPSYIYGRGNAYPPPPLSASPPSNTVFIMKPFVGAMQAWSCVVISVFAIVILSILGLLFRGNHHEMVGGIDDPENGPEVAATIFVAVLIYAGFLVFCGLQGLLHLRENRRGAIAL
ncbi:hypothetical protein SPI_04239 [Niveomyces insectorum RCEF 264]|uniref:Uncharacterized protein n=1 Tax=Niveomyces insectorum RCEF 264 TaxID=1081102 RepID=A0A167VJS0_9HYPO|nr:hypothetical protein SPI_04239 [Niveomyces insectorum RCEF 264]